MFRRVPVLLLLLIPVCALAASEIDAARLSAHVQMLASDEFEGRAPATPGGDKAVDYIVKQFAAAGLQPGAGNGSWLQQIPATRFTITSPVIASARMGNTVGHFEQGDSLILNTTRPGNRVDVADAPMVFCGFAITAPELGWDDLKGTDLKGKVAVILFGEPDLPSTQGKSIADYGRIRAKVKNLVARGVVGIIYVFDPVTVGWLWPTAQSTDQQPQIELADDTDPKPMFSGLINTDAARQLFKLSGEDLDALVRAAQKPDFVPVALNATFSTSFSYKTEAITTPNVIGILPGAKRPDEYVFYTAHWDHLGRGPDVGGKPTIYRGAIDNGSGVASLIEIARAFGQGPRPDRSVVFMATTLEESGLLGARYYTAHPVYPLAKTAADFNFDTLMPFGRSRDVMIIGSGKSDLDRLFAHAARMEGRDATLDPSPGAGAYYRADHFAFASAGVPSGFLQSGPNLVSGGNAAGRHASLDYVTRRYHQTADAWSPDMNFDGIAEDAQVYLDAGRDLANSADWPQWRDGVEFKATRDASADARR